MDDDSSERSAVAGVPRGRHLELDSGGTAFVRTAGDPEAPAILLLHGLGATGALNWAPCFEPLAARGHVIALDHRGHGRGPRMGHRFRLADCADDAAAVLRTLGTGPAVVVGYSMGGPIAQLLAKRHPDVVAGLVLTATARDFRGGPADRLRFGAAALVATTAGRLPLRTPLPAVPILPGALFTVGWALSEVQRHDPAAIVAAAAALGRFTSRDWVHDLDVPSAVIVHRRDRLVPARRQWKLAAALPGAATIEVDLDHLGIGRHPDVYVPALLAALDSLGGADRASLAA